MADDLKFYTDFRHPGDPAETIRTYAAAMHRLLTRQSEDWASGGRGEFSGLSESIVKAFSQSFAALHGHVDAFEATALGSSTDPEVNRTVRNVVANVLADANATSLADAHSTAPKAREGKFDQEQGAAISGTTTNIADKLWQIADLKEGQIGLLLNIIAVILRDIGILSGPASGVSLAEVGKQLEEKLDYLMPEVDGLKEGQSAIDGIIRNVEQISTRTQQEVANIEEKADTLGDLLGRTLVGEGWIINPQLTRSRPNKVPARDIKQELHDIEKTLKENCEIIENPPDDGNGGGRFDRPSRPLRPVLRDRRLKKIFVYAENTFTASSTQDRRDIRVHTPAFDISGWLDLSRLRQGDAVAVEIRLSFADRNDVLFVHTDLNQAKLIPFADIGAGHNFLSASNMLVTITQSASADNFRSPVELAYQFIVESS